MNCPTCGVPLIHKSGETVTEIYHSDGRYPSCTVSYWHSLACPECRRSTAPRGAVEWARKDVEKWSESA